jgi:hypothetical protein
MNAKVKKYMKIKAQLEKLAGKKVEETVPEEKVVLQPEVKKEEPAAVLEGLLPPLAEVVVPVVELTPEVPAEQPATGKKSKK